MAKEPINIKTPIKLIIPSACEIEGNPSE